MRLSVQTGVYLEFIVFFLCSVVNLTVFQVSEKQVMKWITGPQQDSKLHAQRED